MGKLLRFSPDQLEELNKRLQFDQTSTKQLDIEEIYQKIIELPEKEKNQVQIEICNKILYNQEKEIKDIAYEIKTKKSIVADLKTQLTESKQLLKEKIKEKEEKTNEISESREDKSIENLKFEKNLNLI